MSHRPDFDKRMSIIDEMADNIVVTGIERDSAEEIARRWIRS